MTVVRGISMKRMYQLKTSSPVALSCSHKSQNERLLFEVTLFAAFKQPALAFLLHQVDVLLLCGNLKKALRTQYKETLHKIASEIAVANRYTHTCV